MKIDLVMCELGIDVEYNEEAVYKALIEHAQDFMLAGGRLSLDDWAKLAPITRRAFRDAGEIMLRYNQSMIGFASLNEFNAEAVGAGMTKDEYKLRKEMLAEAKKISHRIAKEGILV